MFEKCVLYCVLYCSWKLCSLISCNWCLSLDVACIVAVCPISQSVVIPSDGTTDQSSSYPPKVDE